MYFGKRGPRLAEHVRFHWLGGKIISGFSL